MPNLQDALWFKSQFQPAIDRAVAGTALNVDMITAFACQETGEIWPALRRQGLPTARILELCIGDTIDASPTGGGRRAFPKNKDELLSAPGGQGMFDVARQGLVDMAGYIPAYRGAASRPDKFCHGFGIFQLDLQFFRVDPDYFLQRRYADFDAALAKCTGELQSVLNRLGWQQKTSLTDTECAAVAIAYNTGRYDPAKGLKQGYFDGSKYYGENYFAYLQLARSAQPAVTRDGPPQPERASKIVAEKGLVRKAVAKKIPAKKTTAKKATAKKASAKKATAKKASAKRVAAKRAAARKVVARKAVVKRGAKKVVVKKAPAGKAANRKPVAKKSAAKKLAAKKAGAKKAAAKKAPARKSSRRA